MARRHLFIAAAVVLTAFGGKGFAVTEEITSAPRDLSSDFFVSLPKQKRAFPEELPEGAEPPFAIRGMKGLGWKPEQYLPEVAFMKKVRMNFLMNCYVSMFDLENFAWDSGQANRWWEPLPEKSRQAFKQTIRACKENQIHFCFSMNPQFRSPRPLDPRSDADFEALWAHYDWAQKQGVAWFNLSLDDVQVMEGLKIDASDHVYFVNRLVARLRQGDPKAQFIFCPTWYCGNGSEEPYQAYYKTIAEQLDKDVYLFWTGDGLARITRNGAEGYKAAVGHRLIFWDNYPVNDLLPIMHLGPLVGRDGDLCDAVSGYMCNPMHRQIEGGRLPLMTCADYAWNPRAYDPARSVGQAILHLADSGEQRKALADLAELHPGTLILNRPNCAYNSVVERYRELAKMPHNRPCAGAYIAHIENLLARMENVFPDRYQVERETLRHNLEIVRSEFAAQYRPADDASQEQ